MSDNKINGKVPEDVTMRELFDAITSSGHGYFYTDDQNPEAQWRHAMDITSDLHDAANVLEQRLADLGENQLAFDAAMILSQSLTLLRAIERKRKEAAK